MTRKIKKSKIGFSVIDLVLLTLAVACVLSVVFRDQLRSFLGEEEKTEIEYTFLIENVTEEAKNHPVAGEEVILAAEKIPFGTITSVSENLSVYQSLDNEDDKVEILTLTCKAKVRATKTENGYYVSSAAVKPGAEISVETESASFVMIVTMVKSMEE